MSLVDSNIDINCDLGEIDPSFALERSIMPLIDRCNIAAGAHAGDENSIKETILIALENDVKIGIHPSFPDRENFGRVVMQISNEALMDAIKEQIELFTNIAKKLGAKIDHIKAHGALYHFLAENEKGARSYLDLIMDYRSNIEILIPPASKIEIIAKDYPMRFIMEAFGDRKYGPNRKILSRKVEGAIFSDPFVVVEQVNSLLKKRGIIADGEFYELKADSICVHSDTENSLDILRAIKEYC